MGIESAYAFIDAKWVLVKLKRQKATTKGKLEERFKKIYYEKNLEGKLKKKFEKSIWKQTNKQANIEPSGYVIIQTANLIHGISSS